MTRLEPPYFISLFVCAAAQYVTAHRGFRDMWPHLLASFFYLHNLIFGAFAGAVNGVAWSLEVEIQSYFLVPLLALVFAIGDARLRRTVILGSCWPLGFSPIRFIAANTFTIQSRITSPFFSPDFPCAIYT